jgi:YHS domain-containing protein/positive regulator of sigma E activity
MRETGTVITTQRGVATVQFVPKEACEHCGAKGFCHPSPGKMTAEAVNSVGALVGDEVVIETEAGTSMLAASLVFLVPVLSLILGYLAARKIWGSEPAATAGAIVLMLISVIVLAYFDRKVLKPKRFMPRIKEIVRRGVHNVPKDPVCGMDVSQESTLKTECKGKTYYFCSESCKVSFEKNPDEYLED